VVIFAFFVLILSVVSLNAQDLTVGLLQYDSGAYDGYTLFAPLTDSTTYLIDMYGRVVHSWPGHYYTAPSFYLLENGNVLRCAKVIGGGSGKGGAVEEVTWDGTQVWFFEHHGSNYRAHHDLEPMPNGNVLMVASETKTQAEILDAGRDSAFAGNRGLSVDYIIEVKPIGPDSAEIVWKWDLWDHFIQDYDSTKDNYGVVEEHPELADLNYVPSKINDQIHCNAVDYNPELDQIIISAARYHEIWIIDHSTTTEEAAGHTGGNCGMGGDILWRWGNPLAYRAGDSSDQKLYFQHDPRWIEPGLLGEGNILVFNNGQERPDGDYSSVNEIVPPVDGNGCYPQPSPGTPHGPAEPVWTYIGDPLTDFYSHNISGAHRLPNGNTMICSGANGTFFEVTYEKEMVWKDLGSSSWQGYH